METDNTSCNRLNRLPFILQTRADTWGDPSRFSSKEPVQIAAGERIARSAVDFVRFVEGRRHAHAQIKVVKKATFGLPPVGSPHFRRVQAAVC
jgi:hypothetical protein